MKKIRELETIKALAIFSIICAHLSVIRTENNFTIFLSYTYNAIGCLGVPIFFIISGYLYYFNNKTFLATIKNKVIRLGIPWLFIGSIVYITVFGFQRNISIIGFLKFIIGIQSYLYYLTVLMILYIFYFKLKNNKIILCTSIISITSIICTCVLGLNKFSYLNVFNWIIYFNIGLFIAKKNILLNVLEFLKLNVFRLTALILEIVVFTISIIFNRELGYWTFNGLLFIIFNIIFVFGTCFKYNIDNKYLNFIGNNSLSFYLIHMPIAGFVTRVTNVMTYLIPFRIVFTIIITYAVIWIYCYIINKIKIPVMKRLIGANN